VIEVTGQNFIPTTSVVFNGQPVETTFVNSTLVRGLVSTTGLAPGGFTLSVRNPAPGGGESTAVVLTVTSPLPVGTTPTVRSITTPYHGGPVAVNSTTNQAVVINYGPNSVSVLDLASNTLLATVPVGVDPASVAINGNQAIVTNTGSNNVSIIDLATFTVTATIPVGSQPFGVAADGFGTAVVANNGSNSISITHRSRHGHDEDIKPVEFSDRCCGRYNSLV
jgi:YVTN family beta-propeller protein